MSDIKIISKGGYRLSSSALPVAIKNFIIADDGSRYLLLEMINKRDERISELSIRLEQKDASNRVIFSNEIWCDDVGATNSGKFVLNKKIPLCEDCESVNVEVTAVNYGNYVYTENNGKANVDYIADQKFDQNKAEKLNKSLKYSNTRTSVRSLRHPIAMCILAFLVLISFFTATTICLNKFKNTVVQFTYQDIEYRFVSNENQKDGDIIVVGYKGRADNIRIPAILDQHNVIGVDAYAFADNRSLKAVNFEAEAIIGDGAFSGCENLTQVNFENVKSIGNNAFQSSGINSFIVNNTVSVGDYAFSNCKNLTNIILGKSNALDNGVKAMEIGTRAFEYCSGLNRVDILTDINSKGTEIFAGCNISDTLYFKNFNYSSISGHSFVYRRLKNVIGANCVINKLHINTLGSMSQYFASDVSIKQFNVDYFLQDSISDYAFYKCKNLYSVDLPSNVTAIGSYSFSETSLAQFDATSIDSIGAYAFLNSNLKSINLGNNTQLSLDKGVFKDCKLLTSVTLPYVYQISEQLFEGCSSLTAVNINNSYSEILIGNKAFSGCKALATFNAPSAISTIGENAFSNCTQLKNLDFSKGLRTIEANAFSGCSGLKSLLLPTGLESINKNAFSSCTNLADVALPNTLTFIGDKAFSSCKSLDAVMIPDSVITIGQGIFSDCQIKELTLPFIGNDIYSNSYFTYLFGGTSYHDYNLVPKSLKKVEITLATNIIDHAFYNCSNIETIKIGSQITSIGNYVFYGCSSLLDIKLPVGLESIGEYAFAGCEKITEFECPDTVNVIGSCAFKGCKFEELTVPFVGGSKYSDTYLGYVFGSWNYYDNNNAVPSTLKTLTVTNSTNIDAYAFYMCDNISTINLPQTLTSIDNYAFYGCNSLSVVKFSETLESIGEYAFSDCYGLTEIEVPNSVTFIGNGAFRNCSLEEISLPFVGETQSSNTNLNYIFGGWNYYSSYVPYTLKTVTITNSTILGERAFYSCNNITTVNLPETLTEIGTYAFYGCSSISEINLPESLQTINTYAFSDCYNLTEIAIPNGVTFMGRGAFRNCNLEEMSLPFIGETLYSKNYFSHIFDGWNYYDNYSIPSTLKTVTLTTSASIGENAFYRCENITTVNLHEETPSIGSYAFYNCRRLKNINLPEALTDIGSYAFQECYRLSSFTVPSSIENIGNDAFSGCYNAFEVKNLSNIDNELLKSQYGLHSVLNIYTNDEDKLPSVTVDDFTFTFANVDWAEKCYMTQFPEDTDLVLPSEISYNGMVIDSYVLPRYLFVYSDLTSVKIPKAVTEIGNNVFYESRSLKTVKFEEGSQLKNIPSNAFSNCESLSSINLPLSLEYIDSYAFSYCKGLKEIKLHANLEYINWDAFWECTNLRVVINGSSMNVVVGSSDNGYVAYYAVIVADDEMDIEKTTVNGIEYLIYQDVGYAVGYSDDIYDLVIDEFTYNGKTISDIQIANNAFQNASFYNLIIGEAVSKIGENAFANCYNLNQINISSSVEEIGWAAFQNCYNLEKVTFEEGSKLKYLASEIFSWCQNLIEVTLPSSLERIDENAFNYCNRLKEIELPSTLTEINDYAFYECRVLNIVINYSSLDIKVGNSDNGFVAYYAFAVVDNPGSIDRVRINEIDYVICDDVAFVVGHSENAYDVTIDEFSHNGKIISDIHITVEAFENSNISSLTLGKAVTNVGDGAFRYCYNLKTVDMGDSKITIIPTDAFYYNSNLEYVVLPSTLNDIENYAFYYCRSLIEVCNLSSLNVVIGSTDFGYVAYYAQIVTTSEGQRAEIAQYNEFKFIKIGTEWKLYALGWASSYEFRLPEYFIYNGSTVNSFVIGDYAFNGQYIESMIIPTSVSDISSKAFEEMSVVPVIYYCGNQEEWESICDIESINAYFMESGCIHEYNKWKFDEYGNLRVGPSYYLETTSGNCQQPEIIKHVCTECGQIVEVYEGELGMHNYDEYGQCTICGVVSYPLITTGEDDYE